MSQKDDKISSQYIVTTDADNTPEKTRHETSNDLTSETTNEENIIETKFDIGEKLDFSSEDILNLPGRHIIATEPDWLLHPVPDLADIIVESAKYAKGPEIESLLQNANDEQKERIKELLPLDLAPKHTLALPETETYWKRQFLERYPLETIIPHTRTWKTIFVEKFVQGLVENFKPGESDMSELKENLKIFNNFLFKLQIRKLQKRQARSFQVDLNDENFDDVLDEFINLPSEESSYVDFNSLLTVIPDIKEFSFVLTPSSLPFERFQLSTLDFNSLLRGLEKVKKLEAFKCANNSMTCEQINVLCKLFLNYERLKVLEMSYNFLDNSCCDYLSKILLSPNCPLEYLILKCNQIDDSGTESIAVGLSQNAMLKKLDLSLNWISDRGGKFLAEVVSGNEVIEDLDVSKNKFGSEAGLAFAECLKKSKSLRNLNLAQNKLKEKAGSALQEAIKENKVILNLGIQFCMIQQEDEDAIQQALIRNRCLETNASQDKRIVSEFII